MLLVNAMFKGEGSGKMLKDIKKPYRLYTDIDTGVVIERVKELDISYYRDLSRKYPKVVFAIFFGENNEDYVTRAGRIDLINGRELTEFYKDGSKESLDLYLKLVEDWWEE